MHSTYFKSWGYNFVPFSKLTTFDRVVSNRYNLTSRPVCLSLDELKTTEEEKKQLVAAVDFKRLSESTLQVCYTVISSSGHLPWFRLRYHMTMVAAAMFALRTSGFCQFSTRWQVMFFGCHFCDEFWHFVAGVLFSLLSWQRYTPRRMSNNIIFGKQVKTL